MALEEDGHCEASAHGHSRPWTFRLKAGLGLQGLEFEIFKAGFGAYRFRRVTQCSTIVHAAVSVVGDSGIWV